MEKQQQTDAEKQEKETLKQMEQMQQTSKELECLSCKIKIAGASEIARFPCPKCGAEIIRCGKCRRIVAQFTCSKCGFVGPN